MIGSISEGKYSCVFRSIKDIGYFSGDGGERSLSLAGFAREILRMMKDTENEKQEKMLMIEVFVWPGLGVDCSRG